MNRYDLVVVGGGPGGYVAALEASRAGLSVAVVEADRPGGTCLHRGCIPSKTWLRHAEAIALIEKARDWGIETGALTLSLEKMARRKDRVIERLCKGIESLFRAGKIEWFQGFGTVKPDHTVEIREAQGTRTIKGDKVILATGSKPVIPPITGLDKIDYHTTDTIFDIKKIPESVVIVGGGYIGVEFAHIFHSLGTRVTIVEMAERLLPAEDPDAAAVLTKHLRKKNVVLRTNTRVVEAVEQAERLLIRAEDEAGRIEALTCEEVLVSVGRRPNDAGLELLDLERNGAYVRVNETMETNLPGIYAVGDLVGGFQLAHVASAEGTVAAQHAAGRKVAMDYRAVPRCIYTIPEMASVGWSEREARERGYDVEVYVQHHVSNGKALAMEERDGFVKLIADKTYGEILGVVMVGPHVTEMISEAAAFICLEGTVEEMKKMIHPHPTLSESLPEAAGAWLDAVRTGKENRHV